MARTIPVTAPLSGIYYSAPRPGEPPFVREGQKVGPEDVVALIESMKVFIEVRAEASGTVKRLAVKNEELVSSGQTLVELES